MNVLVGKLSLEHEQRRPRRFGPAYDIPRYTLALVLIAAAGLKIWAIASGMNGWKLAEALLIPSAELGIAIWLLSGFAKAWSRRVAILLLIVFIAVAGRRLLVGNADCGCFGALRVPPSLTFAFDITSLAAFYWLGRAKAAGSAALSAKPKLVRVTFATVVCLVSIALVAARLARGRADHVVVFDSSSWVGRPFPLLAFVQGGEEDFFLASR